MPLLSSEIKFKYVNFIENTYLFPKRVENGYNIILEINSEVLKLNEGEEYIQYLKSSPLFIEEMYPEYEGKIFLNFRIPERFNPDIEMFFNGKYSKMSETSKKRIVLFLLSHFKKQYHVIEKIKGILYKDPKLRKKLEEELRVRIPEDVELSSKVDENSEFLKI